MDYPLELAWDLSVELENAERELGQAGRALEQECIRARIQLCDEFLAAVDNDEMFGVADIIATREALASSLSDPVG
jgi:hypothetical protein